MALDKSALLELTEALSSADDGQLMRRLLHTILQALIDAEAPLHGVSTRKVDDLVTALGAESGISKSEVSRRSRVLNAHTSVSSSAQIRLPGSLHAQRVGPGVRGLPRNALGQGCGPPTRWSG